jgi:hypothetical protein
MTAQGAAIAAVLRSTFEALVELDKTEPHDVDAIVSAMLAHLRSWRPVAVAPLGTLPAPSDPEAIRDPRDRSAP